MKKLIITAAVFLLLLAVSTWFFWTEVRLLTLQLPKSAMSVQKSFHVSVLDTAGFGSNADTTFSSCRLGARRILRLQHAPGESIDGVVVSADILYQLKGVEREKISLQLLHGTAESRAGAVP